MSKEVSKYNNNFNKKWNIYWQKFIFPFIFFSTILWWHISLFFKILLSILLLLFWKTLKSIKVVAKLLLELLRAVLHQKCIFWTSSFRAFFLQSSRRSFIILKGDKVNDKRVMTSKGRHYIRISRFYWHVENLNRKTGY